MWTHCDNYDLPAGFANHHPAISAVVIEADALESHSDDAGRTRDQFQAATIMRAVGYVQLRRLPHRRILDEGYVFPIKDALFAEFQIQASAIV